MAIIGTTFTNKAAGELVERVRQEFFKSRRDRSCGAPG